jgi:hypothetical protein
VGTGVGLGDGEAVGFGVTLGVGVGDDTAAWDGAAPGGESGVVGTRVWEPAEQPATNRPRTRINPVRQLTDHPSRTTRYVALVSGRLVDAPWAVLLHQAVRIMRR